jgi:ribosomal protein S18 acetylase RimI-like enzyme
MTDSTVRPYRSSDRAAVRAICCETAGPTFSLEDPVLRALFADYWTHYYTDFEPEHTWVAEEGGRVIGYLSSAFDTARFRSIMRRRILPGLMLRRLWNGRLFRSSVREFLGKRVGLWFRTVVDDAELLRRYPAHLHVNLTSAARGHGAGRLLMEALFAALARANIEGVHLETSAANSAAQGVFQQMGFVEVGRRRPFGPSNPNVEVVLMDRVIGPQTIAY